VKIRILWGMTRWQVHEMETECGGIWNFLMMLGRGRVQVRLLVNQVLKVCLSVFRVDFVVSLSACIL
jgi:hypothetical protein